MPTDENAEQSLDRSSKNGSESSVTEIARDAQEKPQDLKDKEARHNELRMNYATESSESLPLLDFDFDHSTGAQDGNPKGASANQLKIDSNRPAEDIQLRSMMEASKKLEAEQKHAGESAEDLQLRSMMEASKKRETEQKYAGESVEDLTFRMLEEHAKLKEAELAKGLERLRDNPDVKAERENLQKLVLEKIEDPERQKAFLENMKKFEERGMALEKQYEKQFNAEGLDPEAAADKAREKAQKELAESYDNIGRLLESGDCGNKNLPGEADRILLAEQCIEHCADPASVCQGDHGTCYAATVESRTYARDPAQATRLIADIATTGKYQSNGEPPVTVDLTEGAHSLKRQGQSDKVPRGNGERDYVSQVFQLTATNVALEKQNALTRPPGQLKYEEHPPVAGLNPEDNGARLIDYSKTPPESLKVRGLSSAQTADLARELSPGPRNETVILADPKEWHVKVDIADGCEKMLKATFQEAGLEDAVSLDRENPKRFDQMHDAVDRKEGLSDEAREELHKTVNDLAKASFEIDRLGDRYPGSDPQRMRDFLAEAEANGNMPVIVAVETYHEPFWTDSGAGAAGGSGGSHVVTITEFDAERDVAKLQNQWGREDNHEISLKDLCEAANTGREDKLEVLEARAERNRAEGRVDFSLEDNVLLLKKQTGKITEEEYSKKCIELYQAWSDHNRQEKTVDYRVDDALLSLKHESGEITDRDYDQQRLDLLQRWDRQNKKDGKVDYNVQLDMLELNHRLGKTSDSAYDEQIAKVVVDLRKDAKKRGNDLPVSAVEADLALRRKYVDMIKKLEETDPARGERIRDAIKKGLA